jgi:hypothetical protein
MKKFSLILGLFLIFMVCGISSAYLGSEGKEVNLVPVNIATDIQPTLDSGNVNVLWDISHGDSGSGDAGYSTYPKLISELQAAGYTITPSSAGILNVNLANYQILVISAGTSINTPYTAAEVSAIKSFVSKGNGLIVLDEWYGYKGEPNVEPVVEGYGTKDVAITSDSTITNLSVSQPIFKGVTALTVAATGEISATAPSKNVAWDSSKKGVINIVTGQNVVIIGDCNLFQDSFIGMNNNNQFAMNVFSYVTPTTPILVSPANGAKLYNFPRTTTLSWRPVPGATGYAVNYAYYDTKWEPYPTAYTTGNSNTSFTLTFVGDQPGHWQVTALGVSNAKPSAFWTFSYNTAIPLATPTLVSPVNMINLYNYPRTTTLSWKPVPGASGYQVNIYYYDGKWEPYQPVIINGVASTSYTFQFVGGQPGEWTVQALGAYPYSNSATSAPFEFIYNI